MTPFRAAPTVPTRFPLRVVVVGIAVSAAACGSSTTASTPSQPSNSPGANATAPKGGKARVAGSIASVNGTTIAVNTGNGSAPVDFSQSTKISQVVSASPADLTVGSCVTVRPAREAGSAPGTPVTAAAVALSAPVNGQCFPVARQSGQSPTGAARGLRGTLSSTNGATLVVTTATGNGSTPTTVDVNNTTVYTKRVPAQAQAISPGECITARGTDDANGALQATTIGLRPANNGKCPEGKH